MTTERDAIAAAGPEAAAGERRRRIALAWSAFARDRAALVFLVLLLIVTLAALFAPYISPHDPFEAVNTMRNAAKASLDAMNAELDINSPSGKYMEVGDNIMSGLLAGIDLKSPVMQTKSGSI